MCTHKKYYWCQLRKFLTNKKLIKIKNFPAQIVHGAGQVLHAGLAPLSCPGLAGPLHANGGGCLLASGWRQGHICVAWRRPGQ